MNKEYYVYLVLFSTNRIKVGVTGNINKRIKYYKQEAARHGMRIERTEHYLIMGDKEAALALEKRICKEYRRAAVRNHREWFRGDVYLYFYISGRAHQLTVIEKNEFLRCEDYEPDVLANDLLAFDFSLSAYITKFLREK